MAGSPDVLAGTFAGRYTIERELGSGATATVYLARDTQRGMSVAVKLLRHELSQSVGAERFLREIRLNEKLHHPHIVPVLDSGEHEGRLYFVLPHMEEGSLRQLLQREKQLPIERAIEIAKTVAQALDYAHQQNLIHRDVKPENILFTAGQACLADFGIARAVERAIDESTTDTGLVRGTPAYMSPEQASGSKHYDGRSDLYSLACVLYEMLAGVPAFIGPTPEAVIAQRFQHLPRELRVYRPSAPVALDDVLMKALAMAPADRYVSTAEFAAALDQALVAATDDRRAAVPSVGLTRPKTIAFASALAVIAGLGFGLSQIGAFGIATAPQADSARVAVFPFRTAAGAPHFASQEMVHASMRRWHPLDIVALSEIAEALRDEGVASTPSLSEARAIAAGLGAGRFVLGQVVPTPTGQAVLAEFRDIGGTTLYSSQMELPRDSSRVRGVYAALVDSLLLRGKSDGATAHEGTRHLFATQAFIEAQLARDDWALERADSLLERATSHEPALTRAQLWLAQVRLLRGVSVLPSSAIDRAIADSAALTPSERVLATALLALRDGRFADACRTYQSLIRANSRDFAGWYGLGECQRRDYSVIPDRRSPSGWKYRSDYARELAAYTRAFELLPATYRAYQANGYSRLRALLFTSGRTLRRGVAASGPPKDFLGSIQLIGDSLRVVPFDASAAFSGDPRANADPRAIRRSREVFQSIAAGWSAAFPRSAAAKEAVAISLELQSDRTALDTLEAARSLATDSESQLRFAASRAVLLTKFGAPADLAMLRTARRLADSLLSSHRSPTSREAALLAPIAALIGDCRNTARFLRAAAQPTMIQDVRIPADVVGDAHVLNARALLECPPSSEGPALADVARRIPLPEGTDSKRVSVEYRLLSAAVAATFPLDRVWVDKLQGMGDYVLQAEAEHLGGRTASAKTALARILGARTNQVPGDFAFDATLTEARLLLELGDTTLARLQLTRALSRLSDADPLSPYNPANNTATLAALVAAMALNAQLQSSSDDARPWARAAVTLWDGLPSNRPITLRLLKDLADM